MYFVFAAKFAYYSKYFCKCSMLIENPCARVPWIIQGMPPNWLVRFFPLILCFLAFPPIQIRPIVSENTILTSYSRFPHPILFSVVG